MGIFSFLSKKRSQDDILTSIFKVAEKGMYNFNFPITKEGRFEILMFDVWLGTRLIEEQNIDVNYVSMQNRIEVYLRQIALKLELPVEKKYERVYMFREDGWEHDVMGLIHSDYPRTKQFLPAYMYLCMVAKPLVVFDDETTVKESNKTSLSDVVDFLGPFCEHYSWLVQTVMKLIKK